MMTNIPPSKKTVTPILGGTSRKKIVSKSVGIFLSEEKERKRKEESEATLAVKLELRGHGFKGPKIMDPEIRTSNQDTLFCPNAWYYFTPEIRTPLSSGHSF